MSSSAAHLLERLHSAGVSVVVAGDTLDLEGPEDVLTDEFLAEVVAAKPELLRSLRATGGALSSDCSSCGAIRPALSVVMNDGHRICSRCWMGVRR
jgi:hypothetical protein